MSNILEFVVALLPLRADLLNEVGVAATNAGRLSVAAALFARTVRRDPAYGIGFYNLGRVRMAQGDFADAAARFARAIELGALTADAENNLGVIRMKLNDPDAARAHFQRALEIAPGHVNALVNLAHLAGCLGDRDGALARYAAVVRAHPGNAEAHFGVAMEQLLRGRLRQGWKEYEWRFERSESARLHLVPPLATVQRWQGEPLKGRRILLRAEQGLGDTLQFCRFVAPLKALGAEVFLSVQPSLVDLLRTLDGVAGVCALGQEKQFQFASCDYWSPLLSVARLLDVSLHGIPQDVPYLRAEEGACRPWLQARVASAAGRPRIGLVWAGNPEHENDRNRSLRLEQLDVLTNARCAFFSLQLGVTAPQLARSALAPVCLDDRLTDFSATAAVVAHLDLVIAVDTSVAHLAGALGRPVWLLLPFNGDWRWLLDRSDSPWYPTMRIYRQKHPGDWAGVLAAVAADLAQWADARAAA